MNREMITTIRRTRFNPWFKKIPWRRKWQSTPVLLSGKSKPPWTEEPDGLRSMGSQRVGHDWATNTFHCIINIQYCVSFQVYNIVIKCMWTWNDHNKSSSHPSAQFVIFFLVMRSFKIYSLSSFQICVVNNSHYIVYNVSDLFCIFTFVLLNALHPFYPPPTLCLCILCIYELFFFLFLF